MALAPGTILIHYRLLDKIGEGGMGVVWKAVDTTLDRAVAIKVLPAAFAHDAERLARFQREAKLLASLNHPGIAAVYGFHEADTPEGRVRFLAMELVEGEDLSQRLTRGPLPVDEALEVGARITEALSAAHEAGVIHRDLKPANVKRTPEGKVKVLDFGLAKAFDPRAASGAKDTTNSPTLTSAGTLAGVILGTAAYMSPEQARGRPTDRRTDIWSFGAVLFEMLTGRPPFPGEVISDVIAKVIEREPDWTLLSSPLHPGVRRLLERCLAKDADRRLRDAADARLELEDLRADPRGERRGEAVPPLPPPSPARPWLRGLPWLLLAAAAVWIVIATTSRPVVAPERRVQFEVNPPTGHQFAEFSTAPDGSAVAFVGIGRDTRRSLWVRRLESTEQQQLPGTEGAWFPFWSPDSRVVGFFSRGKLRSIDVATGTTQTIADAPNARGGAWGPDGTILFTPEGEGVLYRVPASGGTPVPVTTLRDDEVTHRFPHFVGGTNRFTYSAHDADPAKTLRRYLAALDSDEVSKLDDGLSETYVPPGYALFVRESTLFAQPLDVGGGRLTGNPQPLAHDIDDTFPRTGRSAFSVSDNGVLMTLARRKTDSRVDAFDRLGRRLETVVPGGEYEDLSLSRDGRQLLFTRTSAEESTVWRMDLARASTTRLLVLPRPEVTIAWSGDERGLIWGSRSEIRQVPIGGGDPTPLVDPASPPGVPSLAAIAALAVSPDGHFAAFTSWDPVTDFDLWLLPLAGKGAPVRLTEAVAVQTTPAISPDSRWIAYASNESGRYEVLVRSAAESAPGRYSNETWLVSNAGGSNPVWSSDGRELYYVSADYGVMAVSVGRGTGGEFQAGLPVRLFDGPLSVEDDNDIFFRQPVLVAADGDRFLFQVPDEEVRDRTIEVVVGWESLLER
jgi:Tol biopolymer transport system component